MTTERDFKTEHCKRCGRDTLHLIVGKKRNTVHTCQNCFRPRLETAHPYRPRPLKPKQHPTP